jgi:tetratricopeptide (TPR) repeat protein
MILRTSLSLLIFLSASLFAQLRTPAPSPFSKVTQAVGVTDISIEYSRPGIKGRQIFGDLVPFGQVWRTGANAVTKISFSTDVKLEGQLVPAGEYSIYTIPNEKEWKIMINKKVEGGPDYDAAEDAASFKVNPVSKPVDVERFTIEISDMTDNSAVIYLKWARTYVPIKLEIDTDKYVEQGIAAFEKSDDNNNAGAWNQVANYYFAKNKVDDALKAVNKSLELNDSPFWVLGLKARILAAKKDYKEAVIFGKKALVAAQKAGNAQNEKIYGDLITEWETM